MGTLFDYLEWRGDLSFSIVPLNEADLYILSKIGTPDLTGIVPQEMIMVRIEDAVRDYFEKYPYDEKALGALASTAILKSMIKLPEIPRYGDLRLCGFRKKLDPDTEEQFSALTVRLPDGTNVVTFRGTDDTLIGWKENFNLSVSMPVPAQTDALEYLEEVAAELEGDLIVAGHSKGGNLAVYAATEASEEVKARIREVYNFDGPGFDEEFWESEKYLSIQDKIHVILPEDSMVGTLLIQSSRAQTVSCAEQSFASHDGYTWSVTRDHFTRCEGLSDFAKNLDKSLDDVLNGMNSEDRRQFVEEFFGALQSTGATTLTEIWELDWAGTGNLAKALLSAPRFNQFVGDLIKLLFRNAQETQKNSGTEKKKSRSRSKKEK